MNHIPIYITGHEVRIGKDISIKFRILTDDKFFEGRPGIPLEYEVLRYGNYADYSPSLQTMKSWEINLNKINLNKPRNFNAARFIREVDEFLKNITLDSSNLGYMLTGEDLSIRRDGTIHARIEVYALDEFKNSVELTDLSDLLLDEFSLLYDKSSLD
jgi:hypothetical protein